MGVKLVDEDYCCFVDLFTGSGVAVVVKEQDGGWCSISLQ